MTDSLTPRDAILASKNGIFTIDHGNAMPVVRFGHRSGHILLFVHTLDALTV